MRRWRMVLGGGRRQQRPCRCRSRRHGSVQLDGNDSRIDAALAAVYDSRPGRRGGGGRAGGLGSSAPSVARWLGDIRRYFPTLGRAGAAARRDRSAQPAPTAARARDAAAQSSPTCISSRCSSSSTSCCPTPPERPLASVVAQVVEQIEQRLASRDQAGRARRARPQRNAAAGPDSATSIGATRSTPTCGTTCPSSAPSFPSGWSATAAVSAACRAT